MNRKLILYTIGGIPGSGKSTLIESIFHYYRPFQLGKYGTLLYHSRISPNDVIILGKYGDSGDMFPGTDRLSMSVITHALMIMEYLRKNMSSRNNDLTVFVEGDRLFCNRWLEEASADEKHTIVLQPSMGEWKRRMEERAIYHKQSDRFLRSRRTKVFNMVQSHPEIIEEPFNNEQDFERVFDSITNHIIPF